MSMWVPDVTGWVVTVPVLSMSTSGQMVARFVFRPDPRHRQAGRQQQRWQCAARHRLAWAIARTVRLNQRVVLTGTLRQARWTGNDGTRRHGVEFVVYDCALSLFARAQPSGREPSPDAHAGVDEPWAV